jgi:hypothetical protein
MSGHEGSGRHGDGLSHDSRGRTLNHIPIQFHRPGAAVETALVVGHCARALKFSDEEA